MSSNASRHRRPFVRLSHPRRWSDRGRQLLAFALLACAALLWPVVAPAQNVQHTENKPDQAMKGDFRVDPSSLGMGAQIPLGNYPGRAGVSLPVGLSYSSKVWRIDYDHTLSTNIQTYTWTRPKYAEASVAGWTSSLDAPLIEFTGSTQLYNDDGSAACDDCDPTQPSNTYWHHYVKRIHVHLPDGSAHELRVDDGVYPFDPNNPAGDFTGVFRAVDGSRLTYDGASRTLYLPDGARYLFSATQTSVRGRHGLTATHYIDRHGNTLGYNTAARQWTDTMGRAIGELRDPYGTLIGGSPLPDAPVSGDYTYTLKGMGGRSVNYILRWRRLSDVLTTQGALHYTGPRVCNYTPGSPNYSPALFASSGTSFVCTQTDAGLNPVLFDPIVLSEIVLPTGQLYRFTYNVYGEIDKLHLPSGGYERYRYAQVSPLSYTVAPYLQSNRGVVERWVSVKGDGSDEAHWQYSTGSGGAGQSLLVTTTAPDGTRTERRLHGGLGSASWSPRFGFDTALVGMAFDERVFSSANVMLRRSLTEWAQSGPHPGNYEGYRNPRAVKGVELLLDTAGNALAQTKTTQYDTTYEYTTGLNVSSVSEYGYAEVAQSTAQTGAIASIPAGALVRTTETSHMDGDAAYRNRHLLGLVSSTRIKNAGGQIVAQSEARYDEAAYPLLTYGGVTGWNDPGTGVRGNATTSRSWLDTTGGWLETHAQYDQVGNVRHAWDARGNGSQVEYADRFSDAVNRNTYAYPTRTLSAVPDPTNNHATNTPLETLTTYDFTTGRVRATTDANGKVTTLRYDENGTADALDRLRRVELPDGGWSEYYYNTSPGNLFLRTRTAINASQWAEAYEFYDGMGRSVRTFVNEGGSPVKFITSDTQYDVMGRVWRVSNSYRSNGSSDPVNPSGLWTTNAYDDLGRVVTVTTPDNAVVSTSYSGNTVTVTDQAGKRRQSVTDALGRLSAVYEDPNGVNYGTSYSYDVLGNLRKVDQGGQLRFFMYDSLGRLIRAKNPEQAANPNLATAADPISGNTQWSLSYAYDANGNLSSKTDARNVTAAYTYDALNRVTTTGYSDGTTPFAGWVYDKSGNGRGRFSWHWTNVSAHTVVHDYDVMGRATAQSQHFWINNGWGQAYTTRRAYNTAGNVTWQQYPSGHTVNYDQFDAAGRLKNMTGNLGDGAVRTYSTAIEYDEASRLKSEQFGTQTALTHKRGYNVRGQMCEAGLGTPGTANRGLLLFYYSQVNGYSGCGSGTDNNGNVVLSQHWVPNDPQASGWQWFNQYYAYDALNRISSVQEQQSAVTNTGAQYYSYDRFGNRTIDASATWGTGIPEPQFTVDTQTNRLGVPAGQAGVMSYDAAGNLTHDSYTGKGNRTYDAENRMTSAVSDIYGNSSFYTYDASGKRVRRSTPTEQVWQIYGLDGELLAEYAANAAPTQPQKEYGYRSGELLVTAESGGQVNWLVADHLGTPRMVADLSGSLQGIRRRDYLPFGEEVGAGIGGRTQAQGYAADNVRQQFAGSERDDETGLDFMQARYFSSAQGRFTSPDPVAGSQINPQSLNRYAYVLNNPLRYNDPSGLTPQDGTLTDQNGRAWGTCGVSSNCLGELTSPITVTATYDFPIILEEITNQLSTAVSITPTIPLPDESFAGARLALDGIGMWPGAGEPFNIASGILGYIDGDYAGGTLSMVSALPVLGNITGVGAMSRAASQLDNAAGLADETYEIVDGVRRAKAAELVGNGTIPAEIMDASGNTIGMTNLPIDSLRSPKDMIDLGSSRQMDRWMNTYNQTKSGSTPPPILAVPGTRGTPIKDVTFGVGKP